MGFPILVRCHLYIESGPWFMMAFQNILLLLVVLYAYLRICNHRNKAIKYNKPYWDLHIHHTSRRTKTVTLGKLYQHSLSKIMTCISNNIKSFIWYVIDHPFPNFNDGLTKSPLKSGHWRVITSPYFTWVWLLIHDQIHTKSQKMEETSVSMVTTNIWFPQCHLRNTHWHEWSWQ